MFAPPGKRKYIHAFTNNVKIYANIRSLTYQTKLNIIDLIGIVVVFKKKRSNGFTSRTLSPENMQLRMTYKLYRFVSNHNKLKYFKLFM